MAMFNAHNWFIDQETAPTGVQADLSHISVGAPAFGTVHMCGGMSRVQIAQFGGVGVLETDVNVTKFYAVDPLGGASQAGIQANKTYIYTPLATISWVIGTGTGVENGVLDTTTIFADGVTVTPIGAIAHDLFGSLAAIGEAVYDSSANDIGYAVLPLPACWGFVTTWKTATTGASPNSNHMLKFS